MSVSVLPTLTQAGIKKAGATYYISLIISILFCLLWIYLMIYVQIPMGILEVPRHVAAALLLLSAPLVARARCRTLICHLMNL